MVARLRDVRGAVERVEGSVSHARTLLVCIALVAASTTSCLSGREGWGRGRSIEVVAGGRVQVRRSTIRVEDGSGDLVMNWIGARVPEGGAPLASLSLVVFEDFDADGAADPDEVRCTREASGPAAKLIFSDVRVPAGKWEPSRAARLTLVVHARASDGARQDARLPFMPD